MKYILITGASSGIGKAMAYEFAKNGHNLILVARRDNLLKEIKEEIEQKYKIDVVYLKVDLSDYQQVHKLYESLKKYNIEVLINNAGFGYFGEVINYDSDRFEKMIDLNIKALTTLTTKFVKDNFSEEKQIINVSSKAGYMSFGTANVYSATKFYVSAFTEALDERLIKEGSKMRAKVLAPGATTSEFFDHALSNKDQNLKENLTSSFTDIKSSEDLAKYTYDLYKSNARVGIINSDNEFELKDNILKIR